MTLSLPPVKWPTLRVIPPSDPLIQPARGLQMLCPGAVTPQVTDGLVHPPSLTTHTS